MNKNTKKKCEHSYYTRNFIYTISFSVIYIHQINIDIKKCKYGVPIKERIFFKSKSFFMISNPILNFTKLWRKVEDKKFEMLTLLFKIFEN